MKKNEALEKLEDILSGGELDVLNDFFNKHDLAKEEVSNAQGFLQGVIFSFKELTNVTDEDINSLNISTYSIQRVSNMELILMNLDKF